MAKKADLQEYQHIVERLKTARLDVGLTQVDVSTKLQKPQSYVSKVEAGEQRIDVIELKKFAQLYKKSITYFLE